MRAGGLAAGVLLTYLSAAGAGKRGICRLWEGVPPWEGPPRVEDGASGTSFRHSQPVFPPSADRQGARIAGNQFQLCLVFSLDFYFQSKPDHLPRMF